MNKDHGRIEKRTIQLSTALRRTRLFPYIEQVFRLEREREDRDGKRQQEVVFGVTSLGYEQANEATLLHLVRGHWTIENRVHYVRDVTFQEDKSLIRTGSGPRVMATLRNLAISLIRLQQPNMTVARATRLAGMNQQRLLALIGA